MRLWVLRGNPHSYYIEFYIAKKIMVIRGVDLWIYPCRWVYLALTSAFIPSGTGKLDNSHCDSIDGNV